MACETTANAFIKTVDPDNGFVSGIATVDTTDLPTTWRSYSASLLITPAQAGHILQFGFQNNASDFKSSGVFYDNVELADPGILYSQNFDSLDINTSPIGDGWRYFNFVFDSNGMDRFGGYSGAAPNATTDPDNIFISAIVDNQGGPGQGTQQLSVFSDYKCCLPNIGHNNPTDVVQVNVFQERFLQPRDTGTTFTFNFDAKRGNICSEP
jgi:hypothetical protein